MSAVYTLADDSASSDIEGIHDRPAAVQQGLADAGTVEVTAMFTCRTSDLPPGAGPGDSLIVDGYNYHVRAVLPDGTGMTYLELERV